MKPDSNLQPFFCAFVLAMMALMLVVLPVQAQNQANVWVFGQNAIVDFNTTPPSVSNAGAINQLEGCASIADQQGNLLFYSDGINVWDATHTVMPNGTGLQGNPSATQSCIIVPRPGNNSFYYIVTVPSGTGDLRYSEVDMSLNGGNGDVLPATKNTFLANNIPEKVTSVSHANGTDFWVLSHKHSSNEYLAFHVSSTGINSTPVSTFVGTTQTYFAGYMKGSPQSDRLALSLGTYVEVSDFDNGTGVVSNPFSLTGISSYGVEFSPNGQLLYNLGFGFTGNLRQYDLTQPTVALINSTVYVPTGTISGGGAVQLAPDGKIYMTHGWMQSNLSIVNAPDSIGAAMNYIANGLPLAAGSSSNYGLPTFIQSFFNPNTGIAALDTCFGDSTQLLLTGQTPDSVLWSFGDPNTGSLDTSKAFNPNHLYSDTGQFSVQLVTYFNDSANNNPFIDTLYDTITIYPIPQAYLGNDTVLCTGDTLPYNLIGGDFDYLWSDSTTSTSIDISQVGSYWLQVSNLCGVAIDTVTVDSIYFVDVVFPNDTLLCDGDTLLLDAWVPFGTYIWQDSTTTTPTFTVTTENTYWAEASNLCGVGSDTILVEFEVVPDIALPADTVLCDNATLDLNVAFSRSTYLWFDGSTDSTLTVALPDTIWAEVTNLCGIDQDTMVVLYDYPLNIDLGGDTVVCVGNSYTLSPNTAGAAHLWQDNSSGLSMLVDAPGTFWLEATNVCGVYSDTVEVDYEIPPTVDLGDDMQLCDGDTVQYDVTFSRASYNWSHGANTPAVSLISEDNYIVTVTNLCGVAMDTVFLAFDFPVDPDLGPNQTLCQGDEWTLDGTQPNRASYVWNTGQTVPVITATASGFYWLKMENTCGVFGDTITLNFRQPPKAGFEPNRLVCGDEGLENSTSLVPKESAIAYRWQDNSQGSSYNVTEEGLYWVELSNECGKNRDSIFVSYQPLPIVELGVDTFFCQQFGARQWDVFQPGAAYLWQDGTTSSEYVPNSPGIYFVDVTDEHGCLNSDQIELLECPVFVWLPNAFTPNNDNNNDIFKAEGDLFIEFELKLYNRWGQLLFETKNIDQGWDGKFNGQQSPVGTYIYHLYYRGENTNEIVKTGTFSLLD